MPEASETLRAAELSDEAVKLFEPDATHQSFLEKLTASALFPDAVMYTAHTMPARECLTWGLSCLRELKTKPGETGLEALGAVERFLADPGDAHRRACKTVSEKVGLKSAAGSLAMAAFFSEGSIAPAERDAVPVPPGVAQKMSGGAIILAVVEEPKRGAERFRRCLALASRTV